MTAALRETRRVLTEIGALLLLFGAAVVIPHAILAWLAVLPWIGLLKSLGWLQ